jgi:ferredoxin
MEVRFADLEVTLEGEAGESLLAVAERGGVPIEAACGGFAGCNTCRVAVVSGALSPMDPVEEPFLDRPGQRLACQALLVGPVTVRLDPGA